MYRNGVSRNKVRKDKKKVRGWSVCSVNDDEYSDIYIRFGTGEEEGVFHLLDHVTDFDE